MGADPFGLVGQLLDGQVRVDALIGEGGFSAVYRGEHLGLGEPVAIKCLKLSSSLGAPMADSFVRRFRDESRILYRLSQGNLHIVRSIAAGAAPSPITGAPVPYMVLEWLKGRSLAVDFAERRARGERGRTLDEVRAIFADAADALGYAHQQGVVHRDLNPGNFFLLECGEGAPRTKVLDFGVAKVLDDSVMKLGPRAQTMGEIRIFAPAYGAPEQFDESLGRPGPATDVYAFALVLLEALLDRPVREGAHLGVFATAALAPSQPTPRTLGLSVSDEVEAVFARATRKEPSARPSVVAFWSALEAAASAPPTRSLVPPPPSPIPPPPSMTTSAPSPIPPTPSMIPPPPGAFVPSLPPPPPARVQDPGKTTLPLAQGWAPMSAPPPQPAAWRAPPPWGPTATTQPQVARAPLPLPPTTPPAQPLPTRKRVPTIFVVACIVGVLIGAAGIAVRLMYHRPSPPSDQAVDTAETVPALH